MSNDLWNDLESEKVVVIRPVAKTAVYRNGIGDIVIRQEDPFTGDDQTIFFPLQYGPAIIAAISKEIDDSLLG